MDLIPQPLDPKLQGCTVARLKEWLDSLPPEFAEAQIGSFIGPLPSSAKRMIAWHYKEEPKKKFISVNSMGTHYSDRWASEVEFVSILD